MNETLQLILSVIILAGVYLLTRYITARKLISAGRRILADLRQREALDAERAVWLDYAKTDWLRFGLRDYRPKALQGLVQAGLVGRTLEGRFYLARPQGQAGQEDK